MQSLVEQSQNQNLRLHSAVQVLDKLLVAIQGPAPKETEKEKLTAMPDALIPQLWATSHGRDQLLNQLDDRISYLVNTLLDRGMESEGSLGTRGPEKSLYVPGIAEAVR